MNACSQVAKERLVLSQLQEFLRAQIKRLIELGYHKALKKTEDEFSALILRTAGRRLPEFLEVEKDQLPILLVIPSSVLPLETQLQLLEIQSDHGKPVWDIEGLTTSSHPYPVFGAEYSRLGDISPEDSLRHQESNRWQVITFAQGLAMIAQCEKPLQYCEGLIFAGSYWHIWQVRYIPEYSCQNGERRIMGQVVQANYPCSRFGLCQRDPIISAGSGESSTDTGSLREA